MKTTQIPAERLNDAKVVVTDYKSKWLGNGWRVAVAEHEPKVRPAEDDFPNS